MEEQEQLFEVEPIKAEIVKRKRDPVWDALAELFGHPTTRSAETRYGKLAASLKRAGADYQTIMERAMSWPLHFPGATLTETALEKHWDRLARPPLRASDREVRELERRLEREQVRRKLDG